MRKSTVKEFDLLECIADKAKCEYLSDLKGVNGNLSKKLVRILQNINANDYSFFEWQDAFIYITGKRSTCGNIQEAKDELVIYLTNLEG